MQKLLALLAGTYLILQLATVSTSCKHDPLFDDDLMPGDTIGNPQDTTMNPSDTTTQGIPCDPDKIYFDLDVLPILLSNCAFSDCHDAASAEDGVILDSYENVMATADVEPFDLEHSEIYEVLVEDDPDKRMPKDSPPLSQDQIQIIAGWINQGALDLQCDPDAGACNTENASYTQTILPVITTHCKGCHSGSAPSGGLDFSTYQGVKTVALNGKLYGAISWASGSPQMPQGGNKLPDCTIAQFKAWIDAGAPEN